MIAAAGLAVGAMFGFAGTLVESAALRGAFWGIDGVGLLVAGGMDA